MKIVKTPPPTFVASQMPWRKTTFLNVQEDNIKAPG
jgi:hypothetical protein